MFVFIHLVTIINYNFIFFSELTQILSIMGLCSPHDYELVKVSTYMYMYTIIIGISIDITNKIIYKMYGI